METVLRSFPLGFPWGYPRRLFFVYGVFVSGSVVWFFLFVCMSLLLLHCYILHLLIFCVSLLFLLLAFVLSAVFLFVCVVFSVPLSLPRLTCSLLYCDWVWLADGRFFGGWGVGGGGAGSMPEAHCAFHLRLRGGGCAHALAREGKRQQRSRGRHSSTEDGASWLKKEKELQIFLAGSRDLVARTAQRTAQVGSRRKKNCRFPWQAAEISWQAQHRGRRKLAQEGKKICRFRGRHSAKRLKIAKSCFIFGFWMARHTVRIFRSVPVGTFIAVGGSNQEKDKVPHQCAFRCPSL